MNVSWRGDAWNTENANQFATGFSSTWIFGEAGELAVKVWRGERRWSSNPHEEAWSWLSWADGRHKAQVERIPVFDPSFVEAKLQAFSPAEPLALTLQIHEWWDTMGLRDLARFREASKAWDYAVELDSFVKATKKTFADHTYRYEFGAVHGATPHARRS